MNEPISAAPPVGAIAHLTLPVGDIASAEAFYVGLLGAKLIRSVDRATFLERRPDRAAEADADNSPLHLAVTFGDSPEIHLFLQRGRSRPTRRRTRTSRSQSTPRICCGSRLACARRVSPPTGRGGSDRRGTPRSTSRIRLATRSSWSRPGTRARCRAGRRR